MTSWRVGAAVVACWVTLTVAAPGEALAEPDPGPPSTDTTTEDTTDTETDQGTTEPDTTGTPTDETPPEPDSSQNEVTLGGDDEPVVIIRHSGGPEVTSETQPDPEPTAEPPAPAEEPVTTPAPVVSETPQVAPTVEVVAPVAAPEIPETTLRVVEVQPIPVGTFQEEAVVERPSVPDDAAGGGAVVHAFDTRTGAPTFGEDEPKVAAEQKDSETGFFAVPAKIMDAASNVFGNVLSAILAPLPGSPVDSPFVWAVLGLVRRQFNTTSVIPPQLQALRNTSEGIDDPDVPVRFLGSAVASPDGARTFVISSYDGGVYVLNDDGTTAAEPIVAGGYRGPTDYFVPDGGLAFSADGTRLFVSRQHAKIIGGLFFPAPGDVVVIGNDPSDPETYLKVIGEPVAVEPVAAG